MCGRFAVFSEPGDLARLFAVDAVRTDPLPPRYNVAPTLDVYAVVDTTGEGPRRRLGALRWGLVPHWSSTGRSGPINARAETVADKPTFRDAFRRRRCLVPADGFYEWREHAATGVKTPHFIHRDDGQPLAFAGLWERWWDRSVPDAEPLLTCTIVTSQAVGFLTDLHPRMPVMLPPDRWDAWLGDEDDPGAVLALLDAAPPDRLTAHPVTAAVNDVRNDGPHLIEPARPAATDRR